MHPMIEKYGKQIANELLDMVIIKKNISNEEWRHFLLKHGIIKQTTKIIRGNLIKETITYEFQRTSTDLFARKVELATPYEKYTIRCANGKGTWVFNTTFKSTEIPQIMEELQ